jgi:hypothetical protein
LDSGAIFRKARLCVQAAPIGSCAIYDPLRDDSFGGVDGGLPGFI